MPTTDPALTDPALTDPAPPGPAPRDAPPGACRVHADAGGITLHLSGAWSLGAIARLDKGLRDCGLRVPADAAVVIDGASLDAIDTACALLVWRRLGQAGADPARVSLRGMDDRHLRILELVRERLGETREGPPPSAIGMFASVGAGAYGILRLLATHLSFLGVTAVALWAVARRPARLRVRELFAQLSQTCLTAIPVVALVMFLIGVVVAYLLGLQASQYGANIFVVDGVALGMVREFSPLLVATIVAGRSGAAFTAQLGTMKLTEEIDAIRTLGLPTEQVLIVPRVLALCVSLPALVFVGNVLGLLGAAFVCATMLDVSPVTFIERMQDSLEVRHYAIGLAKAPVFALFIAVIGCAMGMTVSRDTRAIGVNTTSTVVQSIVAVILLDAFFAVLFQSLDL